MENYFLKMNNEMSELEKITRKCESLIICDVPKKDCEIRGDYWKCYMGNYTKCPVYLKYILHHNKV